MQDKIDDLQNQVKYLRDENNMLTLDNKELKRKLIKNQEYLYQRDDQNHQKVESLMKCITNKNVEMGELKE